MHTLICLGHPPLPGCGKVLTDEERHYYERCCEACERAWGDAIDEWRRGGANADFDRHVRRSGAEGELRGLAMADHVVLAEIRASDGYAGVIEAFRNRVVQLGTTYEAVDAVAGLPTRYVGKLFSPSGMKAFGRTSLGPLLGALGLRLLVVVDEEALARVADRLTPKHPSVVLREARMRAGERAQRTPPVEAEAGGSPTDG